MNLQIKDKNAVIFGGTKGIGKAIAHCFADEGANVALCGRNQIDLEKTVEELKGKNIQVIGSIANITKKETIERFAEDVKSYFGSIDFLILNASAMSADWDTAISTDIIGTIDAVTIFLPLLQKSSIGSIVYISSKAASFGTPGFEAYGSAKAAMTHYMKSLSLKLTFTGIRVNTVSPGDTFVEDGFWDTIKSANPEAFEATKNGNKLGRFCTPEEIAPAVVFLSSPRASYISGANLLIDGASINQVKY